MISKRYRVPYVPPKDYPLNLGLISGEEKKEKEKRKKNETKRRRKSRRWITAWL